MDGEFITNSTIIKNYPELEDILDAKSESKEVYFDGNINDKDMCFLLLNDKKTSCAFHSIRC